MSHRVEASSKVRVLVADDEVCTRSILKGYLEEAGFEVTVAADGDQAVSLAREIRPQVIVLDYMIPPTDGRQIAETIVADERTRHARMVLLTGSLKLLSQEAPGPWSARLQKPPEPDELVAIVRDLSGVGGPTDSDARVSRPEVAHKRKLPPEVAQKFVSRLTPKLEEMRAVLDKATHEELQRSALEALRNNLHQIHGAGALCGFPRLGEVAGHTEERLEEWLGSGYTPTGSDVDELRRIVDELEAESRAVSDLG